MSLGRRNVSVLEPASWVFNRMVDAYEHRPAYPAELLDALVGLAGDRGARIADVGAGLGHLALPLCELGYSVTAVEPAIEMLERLRTRASARGLALEAVHAKAEAMPLPAASFDLVVIADAVHFLDAERAAYEVARILAPHGALALITAELGETPFMRAVVEIMQDAAPRRPRSVSQALTQLLVVAGVQGAAPQRFRDELPVDPEMLEGILRSISFIGPAMNAERYAAFEERIHAIPHEARWARSFTLHAGRRAQRGRAR